MNAPHLAFPAGSRQRILSRTEAMHLIGRDAVEDLECQAAEPQKVSRGAMTCEEAEALLCPSEPRPGVTPPNFRPWRSPPHPEALSRDVLELAYARTVARLVRPTNVVLTWPRGTTAAEKAAWWGAYRVGDFDALQSGAFPLPNATTVRCDPRRLPVDQFPWMGSTPPISLPTS